MVVAHIANKFCKYTCVLFMSNRGIQFVSMPIVHVYTSVVLFMWVM